MPTNLIDEIIKREGGATVTNDPADSGGLTQYGITKRDHPAAWADGHVSLDEARDIFQRKYIDGPKFSTIPPTHPRTFQQLVDFGVNSGPGCATQKLQEILKVEVDGQFGPETLQALIQKSDVEVNNLLMVARLKMMVKIVKNNPSQLKFLVGWVNRACEFLS